MKPLAVLLCFPLAVMAANIGTVTLHNGDKLGGDNGELSEHLIAADHGGPASAAGQ